MFVLSKWQCVALPTHWRALVRTLFYLFHTFLDQTINISRKMRAPRRESASVAPNDVPNCHLDKTNMDNSSMHQRASPGVPSWDSNSGLQYVQQPNALPLSQAAPLSAPCCTLLRGILRVQRAPKMDIQWHPKFLRGLGFPFLPHPSFCEIWNTYRFETVLIFGYFMKFSATENKWIFVYFCKIHLSSLSKIWQHFTSFPKNFFRLAFFHKMCFDS